MGGQGRGGVGDQLSEVNFKISKSGPELKFPFPQVGRGVGDQLWMLSPEMLKSKILISAGGGGGGVGDQLLMLSPEMLKSQIPIPAGGGMGLVTNFQKSTSKFQSQVLS